MEKVISVRLIPPTNTPAGSPKSSMPGIGGSGFRADEWKPRTFSPGSFIAAALFTSLLLSGCGVTYPKESVKESVARICREEYKIDVKVETVGRTMAIYLPLEDLMDFTFAINKDASEKINDVILSVARVVLSTDADYMYYCVIAHDVRIPEIQIIIIKSVEDVKRLLLNDISRGEYSKRVLIDLRLNPQSQKERSVRDVFSKMSLDEKWQEQMMNDFFRAAPTGLGDIGYWNGKFYIKDITQPEFLAEQIASRVKIEFKEDKALADFFTLKAAKGSYIPQSESGRYFKVEVLAEPRWFKDTTMAAASEKLLRAVLQVAAHVVHSYSFEDFDYVEIADQVGVKTIKVSRQDLEKLRTKKIRYEDLPGAGRD